MAWDSVVITNTRGRYYRHTNIVASVATNGTDQVGDQLSWATNDALPLAVVGGSAFGSATSATNGELLTFSCKIHNIGQTYDNPNIFRSPITISGTSGFFPIQQWYENTGDTGPLKAIGGIVAPSEELALNVSSNNGASATLITMHIGLLSIVLET